MRYCIFTMVKDEHDYLDEWISYHINLGIDRIFIYEDINNERSHKEIVDKYDKAELHSCKELSTIISENRQVSYFRMFLNKISTNFDWVFYIDIDEFLTFENETYTFDSIFSQFGDYDAVEISWQNYGANAHISKPEGNVLESFKKPCGMTKRHAQDYSTRKMAINMNNYDANNIVFNVHFMFKGKWCNTDFSTNKEKFPVDKIYIRHYITKSFEEYVFKNFVRGQFYVDARRLDDFFELNPDLSNRKDELIEKYKHVIEKNKIPKKIHYIWLGGKKPENVKKCIDSWKKYASDYEIIEWNEQNVKDIPLNKIEAMCFVHFFSKRQYAFCADILRLKILYEYGGIYFDTDVELIKPIPEYMREHNILALEKYNHKVTNGSIMGIMPKDKIFKQLIDCFNKALSYTEYLLEYGKDPNHIFNKLFDEFLSQFIVFNGDRRYTLQNYVIYPSEYFCPINFITKKCEITDNTILIHHYSASWLKK